MSMRKKPTEVTLGFDNPHKPWGEHMDSLVPLPGIGVQKLRFGSDGQILSNDIRVKGGSEFQLLPAPMIKMNPYR